MSDVILDLIRQIVILAGHPETLTETLSLQIEQQLRQQAGGENLYISKTGSREDKATRNHLIHAQFNGQNHEQLARQYHLTVRQVRNIVHAVEAQAMQRRK